MTKQIKWQATVAPQQTSPLYKIKQPYGEGTYQHYMVMISFSTFLFAAFPLGPHYYQDVAVVLYWS